MRPFYHVLGTVLFLGHLPVASGTWGTAGAVALVLLCPGHWPFLPLALGLAVLLFFAGLPAATWAEQEYGSKDPSQFVLDEVIGYLLAVAWTTPPSPAAALVAFFVFRIADILKVPPGHRLERLPGGYGIMLDDVAAGLYTLAVMIPVRLFLFP